MEIEDNKNLYYVCVSRDGTEYISEEEIKKVEDYIHNNYCDKPRYQAFMNQWEQGLFGDYYSYVQSCDRGIFYGDDLLYDYLFELPKGTIENATGVELSYKEGVKKVKLVSVKPVGIKFQII